MFEESIQTAKIESEQGETPLTAQSRSPERDCLLQIVSIETVAPENEDSERVRFQRSKSSMQCSNVRSWLRANVLKDSSSGPSKIATVWLRRQ